jgi:hypothetical protein
MAAASSPCPAAEQVKLEGAGPALVPPPSLPPAPPPSRALQARWAAADAVVAANLLQIEALGPELETTRARLAIEDEGARREAYGRYAGELEDQRGRCLDRVINAQAEIVAQLSPMAAATGSSSCPAAEQVKLVKPEPVDD